MTTRGAQIELAAMDPANGGPNDDILGQGSESGAGSIASDIGSVNEGSSSEVSNVPHYTVTDRLRSTVRHTLSYTMNNAPLLRFIYKSNRYNRLDQSGHPVGESNDGVFSNMSAKPSVREDAEPAEELPTYEQVSEVPAPPYWESSIMAGYEDEIFVDGLPVGNFVSFFWNMTVSICFQFVGFVITYLLHTSHAAKNGSQAGLGVTLLTFGWSTLSFSEASAFRNSGSGQRFEPDQPSSVDIDDSMTLKGSLDSYESNLPSTTAAAAAAAAGKSSDSSSPFGSMLFSYGLVALGTVILVKAFYDYWMVRRKEYRLLHPPEAAPV
ncbi:DEKNAAC103603 [Brettanomyces naardenensis]|uniref:DEKNAAC103603 n=1 Tax=Brettanomyces naardenensis TaxID=13370 RepID=A0A448YP04_BRENA|nr:DEKNAAC103603 [Brettanomyces naardenensis]